MSSPIEVEVVRVFCDERGDHGNALGIVMDGATLPDPEARQELAFELGFSETVFVDGPAGSGGVGLRIYTPAAELPLAGHPLVGTAWMLAQAGRAATVLHPPAGPVPCTVTAHHATILADPAQSPTWHLSQHAAPAEVESLDAAAFGADAHDYAWAWIDESSGLVRSRAFASGKGIAEDEATGSAALVLCGALGRPLTIHQGRGSVIEAEPAADGLVRVRGRVVHDERIAVGATG